MKKLLGILTLLATFAFAGVQDAQAQCTPTFSGALCEGNPIQFFGNPAGTTHKWDFGGLGSATGKPSEIFTFNTAGTYTIKYETTIGGIPCTGQIQIVVKKRPSINVKLINQPVQCFEGNYMCFADSSKSGEPGGCIKKIKYVFNDGAAYSYDNPTFPRTLCHSFLDERGGTVTLTVEVEDCNGCVTKVTLNNVATIRAKLGIRFTSNKPVKCDSAVMTVTNLSGIGLSDVDEFTWDWGDGTTDTKKAPFGTSDPLWGPTVKHTYKKAGDFTAKLTVKSKFGCSESFTFKGAAQVFKADGVIMSNRDSSCNSDPQFNFWLKDGPIVGATNFLWNFGDDPMDPQNYNDKTWSPTRVFTTGPRPFLVSLTYSHPICGNRTIYDTVMTIGPVSTIEVPPAGILIKEYERYQCIIRDSVHFTNASTFYHNDNNYLDDDSAYMENGSLKHFFGKKPNNVDPFNGNFFKQKAKGRQRVHAVRLWNFGDNFAMKCTTDTKANQNVGINCQYSRDSLPVHWYTPWDEIYQTRNSKQPLQLAVFDANNRRCYTRPLWASDSAYIVTDTIALVPNHADSITKATNLYPRYKQDKYNEVFMAGPGYRMAKYDELIWLRAKDTVYLWDNQFTSSTRHIGPKSVLVAKDQIIKSNSKTDTFRWVVTTYVKKDSVAKDYILDMISKGKKFNIVGRYRLGVQKADTVNYAAHRRMFYDKVVACFQVRLKHEDTLHPLRCESEATANLAMRPPSARRMRKQSIECLGSLNPQYGITFILSDTKPGCTQNWVKINFDSASGKNNWVDMSALKPGNRPEAPMPTPPYAIGGTFPTRFSKHYTAGMIASKDGCVTVGLIVGNGFQPKNPGPPTVKPECVDTVWYNRFACFPLHDPNFEVITPKRLPQGAYKVCKWEPIIYRLTANNKTKADDVENMTWSLYTGNAGPNYDQYYRLEVADVYKRNEYMPGSNKTKLQNTLIRVKRVYMPGAAQPTELDRDTFLTSIISQWDTAADYSGAFDQIKKDIEKLGFDIFDLTGQQIYQMIWNRVGTIGQPGTGSRGCIDTTGYGSLIKFYVVPKQKQILHYRDTSVRPMDSAFFNGAWVKNVVEFRPRYAGYYILELNMSGKSCVAQRGERVTVGFYSKLALTDSIICRNSQILGEPTFRYFSVVPEIEGLLHPTDFWRNRIGQAGQKGKEGFTKWDWSKADDDPSDMNTIFGGFPYGSTGVGNPSIVLGGGASASIYYKTNGLYEMRLTTSDSTGCRDTISRNIYVTDVKAKFGLDKTRPSCKSIIFFRDSAKVLDPCMPNKQCDRIIEWWINWGDGKRDNLYKENSGGFPSSIAHDYTRNGKFVITYAVKTYLGCKDTFRDTLDIPGPKPLFDTLSTRRICTGQKVIFDNLSINPSSSARWIWNFGDGQFTSATRKDTVQHVYTKPGVYNVFLTQYDSIPGENKYCPSVYPDTTDGSEPLLQVWVFPYRPDSAWVNPVTICPGQETNFFSKSDTDYVTLKWYFNDPADVVTRNQPLPVNPNLSYQLDSFKYQFNKPGTYQVIFRPELKPSIVPRCEVEDTVVVYVDSVVADFDIDSSGQPIFCFTNKSKNAVSYEWGFFQKSDITQTGEPFVINSTLTDLRQCQKYDTGCYYVVLVAKSANGCTDTMVKPFCYKKFTKIEPPNVFTPKGSKNADGINDKFIIDIAGNVKYQLEIYNRWGSRVFHTSNPSEGWDGTVNNGGTDCPEGTYYYLLKYKFKGDDKDRVLSGTITLIRP